jgi:hypothetical protein
MKKHLSCSASRLKEGVVKKIPMLGWLPNYDFKSLLISDAIAGVTTATIQIPLGKKQIDCLVPFCR